MLGSLQSCLAFSKEKYTCLSSEPVPLLNLTSSGVQGFSPHPTNLGKATDDFFLIFTFIHI